MPTAPLLLTADPHRTANAVVGVQHHERAADRPAPTDPSLLAGFGTDPALALVERAKGALMHHYGIDSRQALAVLIGWARRSRTPVATIAHALLSGICEGDPQTEVGQRALVRWLEAQLRSGDPGQGAHRTAPVREDPAHETPHVG